MSLMECLQKHNPELAARRRAMETDKPNTPVMVDFMRLVADEYGWQIDTNRNAVLLAQELEEKLNAHHAGK